MDIESARAWLGGLQRHGMKLRLDAMHALLRKSGDPHLGLNVMHVGGTNGKGSVCALAAAALQAAGHRVGLYTSPHLVRFEERIQVDGEPIGEEDLARAVEEAAPVVEEVSQVVGQVTYFEAATLVALQHFARAGVDVAVLEVGLGGRLDATNVVEKPLVSVVTNVGLDHTEVLGGTVEAIAREKGAILKPGVPFVTAATGGALRELLGIARRLPCPTRVMARDFRAVPGAHDRAGQRFRLEGMRRDHGEVTIGLLGAHQISNAAVAAAALEEVDAQGIPVPVEAVRRGFAVATWPGRLQRVPGSPDLLLDGAHNADGVAALARFLGEERLRPVGLFGCVADKDWRSMVRTLAPLLSAAVVTEPPTPRRLDAIRAAPEFARLGVAATVEADARLALDTARAQAGPQGLVLVCGSLYLVGEVLRFLEAGGGWSMREQRRLPLSPP